VGKWESGEGVSGEGVSEEFKWVSGVCWDMCYTRLGYRGSGDKATHVARLMRLLGMPVGVLNAGISFRAISMAFSFKT